MPWQLLMLAHNLSSAYFAIYARRIAKSYPGAVIQFNKIGFFIIALGGIGYGTITGADQIDLTALKSNSLLMLFAGLAFAITNMLSYKVFEYVDAATATIFSTLNIICAALLAAFLINEGLSLNNIVGSIILLVAILAIFNIDRENTSNQKVYKALFLAAVSSIFFATAVTAEKYLLNNMNTPTYLVFGWPLQLLGVHLAAKIILTDRNNYGRTYSGAKFYWHVTTAGILRLLAGAAFIAALKVADNLSLVVMSSGFKLILVALLGALVLHETKNLNYKVGASLGAIIGVLLIMTY